MTNPFEQIFSDSEYFKSMYPKSVKPLYEIIADYHDRLEYDGSMMFDQYPDKEQLLQMHRQILSDIEKYSGDLPSQEDFIRILLLNEWLHRRIRKYYFSF